MSFPHVNPLQTAAWKALGEHYAAMHSKKIKELFKDNPSRFEQYSISFEDILFDYSKNIVDEKTLSLLFSLAEECRLKDAIAAMFNGEKINQSEDRAVLHTALRNFSGKPVITDGKDVMPGVQHVLAQMKKFASRIHVGEWKGYSGIKIK